MRPPVRLRDNAIAGLLGPLSQQDPAAAVAALSDLPDGSLRDSAMNSIAENWGLQDLPAALGWLQGIAAGPVSGRRSAVQQMTNMVNDWTNSDPDAATALRHVSQFE